jgi:hypothetical protein
VLGSFVTGNMMAGERVYPIAWHVDYWDYLGWRDRFAHPWISDRQRHYSTVLGLPSIGTPTLYVNVTDVSAFGTGPASSTIAARMAVEVTVSTTLWLESAPDASPLVVAYDVLDAPAGSTLMIVLVERGLSSVVTAGENMGSTLNHENVARAWIQAPDWSGRIDLTVPDDVVRENSSLIGFVQDWSTLDISGATAIHLAE